MWIQNLADGNVFIATAGGKAGIIATAPHDVVQGNAGTLVLKVLWRGGDRNFLVWSIPNFCTMGLER